MRTETAMFSLILSIAQSDERIRAVIMNGSRTNPQVKKDKYRDYDIVFAVADVASFVADKAFPQKFGRPLIVQEPDKLDADRGWPVDFSQHYAWLMLFDDGNRIDLQVMPVAQALKAVKEDSLTQLLLDKDKIFPEIPTATDRDYWTKAPTAADFAACCNEFWWCLNNVAKGLVRGQLPYVMRMYHEVVHVQLDLMCEWFIGQARSYELSTGKFGKYFEQYLTAGEHAQYLKTYSNCDISAIWDSIFVACDLFHNFAIKVAKAHDFEYLQADEDGARTYLKMIFDEMKGQYEHRKR